MTQIFAAHLRQSISPVSPVSGQYDPEQELWVGDNQLQGLHYPTQTFWPTVMRTTHFTQTPCDVDNEPDVEEDDDPDHDVDP